jgi:DNA repair photolyase
MSHTTTFSQFKVWGAEGGKKSRRTLSTAQARSMAKKSVAARRSENNDVSKVVHGTQEWAAHNVNIQLGCENNCKYCYAKSMGIRFKRCAASDWESPQILTDKVNAFPKKYSGKVMFPTTHDITPFNINECIAVLTGLCGIGNEVLIVTKPHLECVRRLCAALAGYRNSILFRFTIGSADDSVLSFWEPNAPSFSERKKAVEHAYYEGFRTSISCEPMLDTNPSAIINSVREYVTDSIWLGRVNQLPAGISMNCPKDDISKIAARDLLGSQTDLWIRDLYSDWRGDKLIKWKDSVKKVVGLRQPTTRG